MPTANANLEGQQYGQSANDRMWNEGNQSLMEFENAGRHAIDFTMGYIMEFGNPGRKTMDFTIGYIELAQMASSRLLADLRTDTGLE